MHIYNFSTRVVEILIALIRFIPKKLAYLLGDVNFIPFGHFANIMIVGTAPISMQKHVIPPQP